MVAVNGAGKHSRYERNQLQSLQIMSNVKVFAKEVCQLNGQPNATDYNVPYLTETHRCEY